MIFKCRKIVGSRGFAPDPTGGAYNAPIDPLADSGPPTIKKPTLLKTLICNEKKLAKWVISPPPFNTGRFATPLQVAGGPGLWLAGGPRVSQSRH